MCNPPLSQKHSIELAIMLKFLWPLSKFKDMSQKGANLHNKLSPQRE